MRDTEHSELKANMILFEIRLNGLKINKQKKAET